MKKHFIISLLLLVGFTLPLSAEELIETGSVKLSGDFVIDDVESRNFESISLWGPYLTDRIQIFFDGGRFELFVSEEFEVGHKTQFEFDLWPEQQRIVCAGQAEVIAVEWVDSKLRNLEVYFASSWCSDGLAGTGQLFYSKVENPDTCEEALSTLADEHEKAIAAKNSVIEARNRTIKSLQSRLRYQHRFNSRTRQMLNHAHRYISQVKKVQATTPRSRRIPRR